MFKAIALISSQFLFENLRGFTIGDLAIIAPKYLYIDFIFQDSDRIIPIFSLNYSVATVLQESDKLLLEADQKSLNSFE